LDIKPSGVEQLKSPDLSGLFFTLFISAQPPQHYHIATTHFVILSAAEGSPANWQRAAIRSLDSARDDKVEV
jgi:hypothetical protein